MRQFGAFLHICHHIHPLRSSSHYYLLGRPTLRNLGLIRHALLVGTRLYSFSCKRLCWALLVHNHLFGMYSCTLLDVGPKIVDLPYVSRFSFLSHVMAAHLLLSLVALFNDFFRSSNSVYVHSSFGPTVRSLFGIVWIVYLQDDPKVLFQHCILYCGYCNIFYSGSYIYYGPKGQ